MELPTYFDDFIKRIRISPAEAKELREAHTKLTSRLKSDENLKGLIIETFLQGSYKRSTLVKPANGKKSDVDVVVVTKIGQDVTPLGALNHFTPFVRKHYQDNFEPQNRSIGIIDGNAELDLVVTSAPSKAQEGLIKSEKFLLSETLEEFRLGRLGAGERRDAIYNSLNEVYEPWKEEPLNIPDKKIGKWVPTHPVAQIKWTVKKNQRCNDCYLDIVKAIKWWHRNQKINMPKYPKGYPLEHIIGFCCPDGVNSTAEGVTKTFEGIISAFAVNVANGTVPDLKDHGVDNNVLRQISPQEFKQFYNEVIKASKIAREALDEKNDKEKCLTLWKSLFGEEFDPTPDDREKKTVGFVKPENSSEPRGGRFG